MNYLRTSLCTLTLCFVLPLFATEKDSTEAKAPATFFPAKTIAGCEFGTNRMFGGNIQVFNLGPNINTRYSEYNQVLNQAEDFMLFTARRDSTTGEELYKQDRQYYEDILISQKVNGLFAPSKKLENAQELFPYNINTAKHEAPVFLGWDEKRLILFKEDKLWFSELGEEGFGEPVLYEGHVNRDKYQRHASYTADGNTLYFSSEVRQAKDPKRFHYDVFVTSYNEETNKWSKPEALPAPINGPYNEDSPEISADGKTMYYSSDRLEGFGGYDIYMIQMNEDGTWTDPVNLCEPINSPANDIFFKPARDGNTAYFSSSRLGGYGAMDIYKVILDIPRFTDCNEYKVPVEGSNEYLLVSVADTIIVGQPFVADGAKTRYKGKSPSNWYWKLGGEIIKNTSVLEQLVDSSQTIDLSMSVSSVDSTLFTIEYACVTKQLVAVRPKDVIDMMEQNLELDALMSDNEILVELDNRLSQNPLNLKNDVETTQKNTSVTVNVLENDPGSEQSPLTLLSNTQPNSGTVRIVDANQGTVIYTPVKDFTGVDNFTYRAKNTNDQESMAYVAIKVLDEDQLLADQALKNDYRQIEKNQEVQIQVFENDSPASGTTLSLKGVTDPSNGNAGIIDPKTGLVSYKPNQDFTGVDAFTYTAIGEDGTISTALVKIHVTSDGVTPVSVVTTTNDIRETMEGQEVAVELFTNDSYIGWNSPKLARITKPGNGVAGITNAESGIILYKPSKGFIGTDAFTYTTTNADGDEVTEGVTIIVKPDPRLYALELVDDAYTTAEDTPVSMSVLDNDNHKQGLGLRLLSTTEPVNGKVEITSETSGIAIYTPTAGFNGTDNFRYTAVDELGIRERAYVTVTVSGVAESLLLLADDAGETRETEPVTINLLSNDVVKGGSGIEIVKVDKPSNGSVQVVSATGGDIRYTPNVGFTGREVFLYEAKDEKGNTATAKVTIDVKPGIAIANIETENLPDLNLEPIYFDFDKDFIRKDAREIMARNIEVLKQRPDLIIKVLSHCDSRGTNVYNIDLSNRRARNTVNYLVNKGGISKERIIATVGLGEEQLVNDCGDDKDCSRAQHQLNRRSDFVIVGKVKE